MYLMCTLHVRRCGEAVSDILMWRRAAESHVYTTVLNHYFCLPSCPDIQFRSPCALGDVVQLGAGDPLSGDLLGADPHTTLTAPWLRTHERHNHDTHKRLAINVGVVVLTALVLYMSPVRN